MQLRYDGRLTLPNLFPMEQWTVLDGPGAGASFSLCPFLEDLKEQALAIAARFTAQGAGHETGPAMSRRNVLPSLPLPGLIITCSYRYPPAGAEDHLEGSEELRSLVPRAPR